MVQGRLIADLMRQHRKVESRLVALAPGERAREERHERRLAVLSMHPVREETARGDDIAITLADDLLNVVQRAEAVWPPFRHVRKVAVRHKRAEVVERVERLYLLGKCLADKLRKLIVLLVPSESGAAAGKEERRRQPAAEAAPAP